MPKDFYWDESDGQCAEAILKINLLIFHAGKEGVMVMLYTNPLSY